MPLIINPPFKTSDSALALCVPLWAGELSGSSFKSKDINKHLCTVTGALWTPLGRTLDGDDYINCGTASSLNVGTQDWTLLWWMSVASWGIPSLTAPISKKETAASGNAGFAVKTGYYEFQLVIGDGTNYAYKYMSTSKPSAMSQWALVCQYGVSVLQYVNAVYQDSLDISSLTGSLTSTAPFLLGAQGTYYDLKWVGGVIGEAILYIGKRCTPQEIQQDYLAKKWRCS